jgi:hypothetical protein
VWYVVCGMGFVLCTGGLWMQSMSVSVYMPELLCSTILDPTLVALAGI